MSDTTLNRFLASGTAASRAAFTPDPAAPISGPNPTYLWWETDTDLLWAWDYATTTWERATITDFLGLSDTPSSYTGEALKFVRVNAGETGLEFAAGGGGGGESIPEAAFTTPAVADFSATRAGSGSIADFTDDTGAGVALVAPGTSTNTNSLIYGVLPIVAGASGWRYTARVRRITPLGQWAMMGLILRDGSGGGSVTFGIGNDSVVGINKNVFSNDTTFTSVTGVMALQDFTDLWLRIHDDRTNRILYMSRDGVNFIRIFSESRTAGHTPTTVGVFMNPNMGGTGGNAANLRSAGACDFRVYSHKFESLP